MTWHCYKPWHVTDTNGKPTSNIIAKINSLSENVLMHWSNNASYCSCFPVLVHTRYTVFHKKDPFLFFLIHSHDDQFTAGQQLKAPVETIKLVPLTHHDVSITSLLTKNISSTAVFSYN